jgi:ribosomal protein L22
VRRYTRGVGRKSQATVWGVPQGRWPLSCVNALIDVLKNAQSNATTGMCVSVLCSHRVRG